ncbi:sensor histidine kinase [Paenibacillus sp. GCM10023252]|uniref:cache domain-containing sensor histidine kinase n=1 Tax=Paenibacillus sp. GCM10023252 TaxID=3252649 RepID=UPI00360D833F
MRRIRIILRVKQWYMNLSIVNKMYSTIFIFIPLVALLLVFSSLSADTVLQGKLDTSLQNLDLITRGISPLIDRVEDASKFLSSHKDVQDMLKKNSRMDSNTRYRQQLVLADLFDDMIGSGTNLSAVALYDKTHKQLASSTTEVGMAHHSLSSQGPWLIPAGKPLWVYGERVVYAVSEIYDYDTGNSFGYLVVAIHDRVLSGLYKQSAPSDRMKIAILSEDGSIISAAERPYVSHAIDSPYFQWLSEQDRDGRAFSVNGEQLMVLHSRYSHLGWHVVGMIPYAEFVKDTRGLSRKILLLGSAAILLEIMLLLIISRSITKPIVRLNRSMNEAGMGNFKNKLDMESRDEIGRLAYTYNSMISRIAELIEEVYREQREKRDIELTLLQSQIKPHFLYNTLESIAALVELDRKADAYTMVNSLSMFYKTLLNKGREIVTIREELHIVRHYVSILQIRYPDQFRFDIRMEDELLERMMVKLSLQPIVENAVYHGIRNRRSAGEIVILGSLAGSRIILEVQDNGQGFRQEDIQRMNGTVAGSDIAAGSMRGFGLQNVQDRLKLIYGYEFTMKVSNRAEGGASVMLVIPDRGMKVEGDIL